MTTSYGSRKKCSSTCSKGRREEPDVTLDDVALVVAGLNNKVLQLRREIQALKESPRSGDTDGRAGRRSNTECGRSKFAGRKRRETRSEDNEYYGSSSPFWRDDISRKERDSRWGETCKNFSHCRNRRKHTIPAVDREESSISGETTKDGSTSTSSDRDRRRHSKNQTTQTFESPKDTKISTRNRVREDSVNADALRNREQKRHSKEPEKSRNKSISNGNNAARSVRKKRISRGVQVEPKDNKKSGRSRGCCSLKCCGKKKKNPKTNVENTDEKQYGSESSDVYQPTGIKNEKNAKNRKQDKSRISGGGERSTYPKLKNTDVSLQPRASRVNNPQRRYDKTRRSGQATEDQWVQKNEAADVKRRLNECLVELNGIIGDVSHLFKENNENS